MMSIDVAVPNKPVESTESESSFAQNEYSNGRTAWNRSDFSREQIRGLVRQIFFSSADRPARQIVLSAVDADTEILGICRQVGEVLAQETKGSVAVVGRFPEIVELPMIPPEELLRKQHLDRSGLRGFATKRRSNLWWLSRCDDETDSASASTLHTFLGQVRREFDYSILEGACAADSHEPMAMAQFADGIILVLSAQRTRRAVAKKVKTALDASKARLLGTVLSDRTFPIPEALYRRL